MKLFISFFLEVTLKLLVKTVFLLNVDFTAEIMDLISLVP